MKKTLKILAVALGVLIVVFLALAVVLAVVVDPNQYKGQLVSIVKDRTGRELKIEGKIGLSFFPWLGVEIGGVELANAAGFGKEPFARVTKAGAKVRLLPLLRGQVTVDTILLDGLALNLARNAKGQTNWDDLTGAAPATKPAPPTGEGPPPIAGLAVAGIDVRDSRLSWHDAQARTRYTLQDLELKTGNIAAGKPVDVRLAFDIEGGAQGEKPLRTRAALNGRLSLDLEKQTLQATKLSLSAFGLSAETSLTVRKLLASPSAQGTVAVAPFNPREVLGQLGVGYTTADKKALSRLALTTRFDASASAARLDDLRVTLDDSELKGSAALPALGQPVYRFDLALDQIDLDRYLPPGETPAAAPPGAAATAAPVALPLDLLRTLDVDGKLRIGRLTAFGLRSSDVTTQVKARGGVLSLGPNQAKLYGGEYGGQTTIDVRRDEPLLTFEEELRAVQLGPFLKDAKLFDRYSGTGNVQLKLTARGFDDRAIKRTLNGTVEIALRDGKIEGVNLQKIIADARRLYDKARGKPVQVTTSTSDETAFKLLRASVRVTNGVARNDDLVLDGPVVRATGSGSADLVRETLDYRLQATVAEGEGHKGTTVPVRIGGTFAKPEYSVELGAALKREVEEKLEQKQEKLEQKLEDKLRDKLRLRR